MKTVSSVVTLDVACTYDSLGRMLTRKLSTDTNPTRFEWDGWDIIRELHPDGTEILLFAPQGEIFSGKATYPGGASTTFQVHTDALGSIRAATIASGAKVSSFVYDAWGATSSKALAPNSHPDSWAH